MSIALKFTSLLVKTLSKPIAQALKAQAKEHETFRKGFITVAQTVHKTDLKLRMSLLGEKKIKIRPLNDTKAIDNGANFLSEFFIFSVAGSLIIYESYRSRKKANDERESIADDITVLQSEIEYLKSKLGDLNVKLDDYKPPEGYYPKYIKLNKQQEGSETANSNGNEKAKTNDERISEIIKSNKDHAGAKANTMANAVANQPIENKEHSPVKVSQA